MLTVILLFCVDTTRSHGGALFEGTRSITDCKVSANTNEASGIMETGKRCEVGKIPYGQRFEESGEKCAPSAPTQAEMRWSLVSFRIAALASRCL